MILRGDRLREARKNAALSQDQLAELMDTDQAAISLLETGKGNPTAETMLTIARVLRISIDWLLGLTDDPSLAPRLTQSDLSIKEREVVRAWRQSAKIEAIKIIMDE